MRSSSLAVKGGVVAAAEAAVNGAGVGYRSSAQSRLAQMAASDLSSAEPGPGAAA